MRNHRNAKDHQVNSTAKRTRSSDKTDIVFARPELGRAWAFPQRESHITAPSNSDTTPLIQDPVLAVLCLEEKAYTCSQSSSESRAESLIFQAIILPNHRGNRHSDNIWYLVILSYNMPHVPDLPCPPNLLEFLCLCHTTS